MQPTIYETMGGGAAVLALASAWHDRCLADEIVSHAFSHPAQHPEHLARLAAYWGEALGGPALYSATMADQRHVVILHSGNGLHTEMDDRAIACFAAALDDVAITDETLRKALLAYFERSTRALAEHPDPGSADAIAADTPVPHWTWNTTLL